MNELQKFSDSLPHPDVIQTRLAELAGERRFLRQLLKLAQATARKPGAAVEKTTPRPTGQPRRRQEEAGAHA